MAEGLNRVLLLGNLGADPELRVTPGGQAILKLRLATTETYLDKNNVRQERTEWHRVTIWGRRGEALAKFLQKGDSIFIEGRIQTSSYEKNGEKRYSTDIIANNVILTGGRGRGEGAGAGGGRPQRSAGSAGGGGGGGGGFDGPPPDDFDQGGGGGGMGGGGGGGVGGGGMGGGEDDIPF
ncbi:MAG TPA: single-stranded DNA-binding protein [Polyangiaceae bacterium]